MYTSSCKNRKKNEACNEHRAQRTRLASSIAPQASHAEVFAPAIEGVGAVASVTPGIDVPTVARSRGRNRKHPDELPANRSRKARSSHK
jgi:hypothetical protein